MMVPESIEMDLSLWAYRHPKEAAGVIRALTKAVHHASARFSALAENFQEEGKDVDWAMCEADETRMLQALSTSTSLMKDLFK